MRKKIPKVQEFDREGELKRVIVILLFMTSLLSFSFFLSTLNAQFCVTTTGDNISGSGGSVSFSVGQVIFRSYEGANGFVIEGVQQPYEISVTTSTESAKGISLSVSAYPNPTRNDLILEFHDFELSGLRFQLFNVEGKILQSKIINANPAIIKMENLSPAIYFVKVIQDNQEVKTFKIVKRE